LAEVLDVFAVTVGLCVTFLVASWFVKLSTEQIPLSIAAVISPIFFAVYLAGPPEKYEKPMAGHLSDFLAVGYLVLTLFVVSYLTSQV
jgi:hypothetical protein